MTIGETIANKIAYYEDLEKQGRLLILPCPPDTTVYEVRNNADACYDCTYFQKGYCCDDYCDCETVTDEDGERYPYCPQFSDYPLCEEHFWEVAPVKMTLDMIIRDRDKFGKTIFLEEKDAAKKLEEIISADKQNCK